jgi:hypothetical protein
LDEYVTTTFHPSGVLTIRSNEMRVLVKLELSYSLLQC